MTIDPVLTSGYRTLVAKFDIDDNFVELFNDCEESFASLWSCLTYQVSMDKARSHLFDHYYKRCLTLFRKEISVMVSTGEHGAVWFVGMLLCGISVKAMLFSADRGADDCRQTDYSRGRFT